MVLELDSVSTVTKLNWVGRDCSIHGPLAEDIKALLRIFTDYSVRHVRRACNEVAHKLEKDGCVNNLCNTWLDVPPGYIVNLVASECAGFY